MEYVMQLDKIGTIVDIIRIYFINLCTYYICFKIINMLTKIKEIPIDCFIIFLITMMCKYIKDEVNFLYFIISTIILIGCMFSIKTKNILGYSIVVTIISLVINYIVFIASTCIYFLIFSIIKVQNDYVNILLMLIIYSILIYSFLKIKRFKKGFSFLNSKLNNEYFDIVMLNISIVMLFTIIIIRHYEENLTINLIIGFIIFSIMMIILIQKSLKLYYQQKMLVKDLEETKEELENKKKEVEQLEKENLEFSKVSHSIAHKQKSLEYKLNELSMKNEITDEIDIKDRIKNLNKGIKEENILVLDRTGITQIDDMLIFMQSECVKNKIDFQLQLSGNIYTMINHYIDKDELEILLADHIKNAIIAIGYGDNINKSILVRLGKLDGNYGLYIYDSGIEFEIETLLNLGKKPSTTHKDSGGTGMGFMNTFDTLKKNKASFIIEEYGKPIKDNFTKALKFKFDNNCEFKIYSYREEQIKIKDKENDLVVEKLPF